MHGAATQAAPGLYPRRPHEGGQVAEAHRAGHRSAGPPPARTWRSPPGNDRLCPRLVNGGSSTGCRGRTATLRTASPWRSRRRLDTFDGEVIDARDLPLLARDIHAQRPADADGPVVVPHLPVIHDLRMHEVLRLGRAREAALGNAPHK